MSTNGHALAADIVRVCGWMYQKGFIASSEGNVSVRLESELILITPKGVHKGFLHPEHLVVADLDGRIIDGNFQPSSEISLHLAVYRERLDVQAVIHAHPTTAVACTLAGLLSLMVLSPKSLRRSVLSPQRRTSRQGLLKLGQPFAHLSVTSMQ